MAGVSVWGRLPRQEDPYASLASRTMITHYLFFCCCSASNSELELLAKESGLVSVRNREFWKILFTNVFTMENLTNFI